VLQDAAKSRQLANVICSQRKRNKRTYIINMVTVYCNNEKYVIICVKMNTLVGCVTRPPHYLII